MLSDGQKTFNGGDSMTENLKTCPFCGGKAELRAYTLTTQFVQCSVCRSCSEAHLNDKDAIKAWNKRYTLMTRLKRCLREMLGTWLDEKSTKSDKER